MQSTPLISVDTPTNSAVAPPPTLDIVNLIENNPVTRLSNTYNGRLLNKIKDNFTEAQQQLFVASFYCYLNYNPTTDFVIDLDNVWGWVGFSQKVHAKTTLEKNFKPEIDYKCLVSQPRTLKNARGGHNKETIMLTVKTFKRFCMKAGTAKANEIHDYFINLEELLHQTVQEESDELKLQLETQKQECKQAIETVQQNLLNVQQNSLKSIHDKLFDCFQNKNIVYIFRIRDHEQGFIIKIGSTHDLKTRFTGIRGSYKCTPYLMWAMECKHYIDLENIIHKNNSIKQKAINLHEINPELPNTVETYAINETLYNTFIHIIKNLYKTLLKDIHTENMKDKLELTKTELQLEELRLQNNQLNIQGKQLDIKKIELEKENREECFTQLEKDIANLTNELLPIAAPLQAPRPPPPSQIRQRNNVRSPFVFQFDPITGAVVKKHDSIISVLRAIPGLSPSGLKCAAKANTIYRNYRWVMAERDATEPPVMPPTIEAQTYSIDYVAMIDIKRQKILDVFPSQKEAATSRNLKGFSTISRAIKEQRISSGHYWNVFSACTPEMQQEYLQTHKLPERHVRVNCTCAEKIDPVSDAVVKSYNCITDLLLENQMSRLTLKKIVKSGEMYNGYKWRIVAAADADAETT